MTQPAPRAQDVPFDEPVGDEPFGQAGVREHFIPLLSTLSLVVMVIAMLMWVRSYYFIDGVVRMQGQRQYLVQSVYGRLLVAGMDFGAGGTFGESGWDFNSRPMPNGVRDGWRPSPWKRLGIEYRAEPLRFRGGPVGGWWLRVRWPTLAGLAVILPGILALRDRWQRHRDQQWERQQASVTKS